MAEDEEPSVRIVEKQEEQVPGAQSQRTWFAKEANSFSVPVPSSQLQHIKIRISNKLLDLRDSFRQNAVHELETGLGFNLMPVFLAIGILIFFSVPVDPSPIALTITVLVLSAIVLKLKLQSRLFHILLVFTAIAGGMLAAQLATNINHTPMLERQMTGQLQAVILGVDQNRRGSARYLVKPIALGDLQRSQIPNRLRVSAAAKHDRMMPSD